jgi:hypothetical protein
MTLILQFTDSVTRCAANLVRRQAEVATAKIWEFAAHHIDAVRPAMPESVLRVKHLRLGGWSAEMGMKEILGFLVDV